MEIEKRALYNLMRMNWMLNPNISAEPWQVEDYRVLPIKSLFERLSLYDINLEKENFLAFADQVDSPEELVDWLLADIEVDAITQDKVYLLLFELWRRLITERPCLSIFCDELDHQIYLYDHKKSEDLEALQDAVANLQTILDENTDSGVTPTEVFASICGGCANDIESFLYDYISDHLDHGNEAYAADLIDGFINYIQDVKWFNFLRMRLSVLQDSQDSEVYVQQLTDLYTKENDLEFNMEVLSFMVQHVSKEPFLKLLKKTLSLIANEEDFQDLLNICIDFCHFLDFEDKEMEVQKILRKRSHLHLEGMINSKDPAVLQLLGILSK